MYKIKGGNEAKNTLYGWAETPTEANKIIHEYVKKQEKNGAFNKRIFLISTADKEYVDHNKGCITCINGSCTLPTNEKYDYEDDGKLAGYYCKGYKSVYKK